MDTMQGKVKRQWELEGLDCANCARKIEDKVKKLRAYRLVPLILLRRQ